MAEENNVNQVNENIQEEQEIDLIALVKRLWKKRKFVIYVTLAFMVLGLLVALFSPKVYTTSCLFVPQTSSKGASSSLSSLASLAGINLNQMNTETLSPMVYPQVLSNIDFRKELMYSKIKFEEIEEPITILDYYTNEEYNKPSAISYVAKYTVGLPFVILKAIRGDKDTVDVAALEGAGLNSYSEKEYECSKILGDILSLTINDKDGYMELSASMPEASAAAELASIAFDLLGKYVTQFKIEKAQATLDYVDARLEEAKSDFAEKQMAYASFRDANRNLMTATSQIRETKLRQEYDLANTIYTELARQKIQVELQVKEDTPVLSVVKPVVVPLERSKPKRSMILIAFTFLGACLGCGAVFGLDFIRKQGSSWPKRWLLPEEEAAAESLEQREKEVVA